MDYSIGEFSKLIGVSIYTLCYYETEKLITPDRQSNGREGIKNDRKYEIQILSWKGIK